MTERLSGPRWWTLNEAPLNLFRTQRCALVALTEVERLLAGEDGWDTVYSIQTLAVQRLWIEIALQMDEYRRAMGFRRDQHPFAGVAAFANYLATSSLADLNSTRIRFESLSATSQLREFIESWSSEV